MKQNHVRDFTKRRLFISDSEPTNTRIFTEIAAQHGKIYTEELKFKIMGTPAKVTCQTIIDELELPLALEEFLAMYHDKSGQLLANCPLIEGVDKIVKHLHSNNIPMAVATSSDEPQYTIKTATHKDLFDLFHHAVLKGLEPQINGKPAPDIFLLAAQRFPDNPPPNKCLVFEDSPNGVQAAMSAGMQCVMVPDPTVDAYKTKMATLVIQRMDEFRPEMFGLPPY